MTKFPSRFDVEKSYSPTNWGYTAMNAERAYKADCPELVIYDMLDGDGSSVDWIYIQVLALYGSSSNSDKGVAKGISIFASSFAAQVRGFKLSELMLFFARYKAGKYDNSYSTFDAKRIGNAFFKEFLPERNQELDVINRRLEQEEIEKRKFIPPEGYSSLTWHEKLERERKKRSEHHP